LDKELSGLHFKKSNEGSFGLYNFLKR